MFSQQWVGVWFNGLALAIVAIATELGFVSEFWWGFSYLDYPRPQYCLFLVIGLVFSLFLRQPWEIKSWFLLGLIPLFINGYLIAPLLIPIRTLNQTAIPNSQRLQVLHITSDHKNPDAHQPIQFIQAKQADVVSVLEITPHTLPQFQAGLSSYQLVAAEPRTNSHGSAWFVSKAALARGVQFVVSEVIHLPADSDRPILTITLMVEGQPVRLVCFHAIRPQSAGRLDYQVKEFAALVEWSQQQPQAGVGLIVIGDFNSTPWATRFRQTLVVDELVNSQLGFGLQPTWPSQLPAFLRIPIDHCLHSPTFTTLRREVGAKIGSDHLPLFVELGWNRAN